MKTCNYCHVSKNEDEFPLKKDGSRSGNCQSCKDKRKETSSLKKEEISEERKQYYKDNKKEILKNRKQYYQNNKEEIDKKNKENYNENREEYLKYKKEYYTENKDHYSELDKKNRRANPEKYLWKAAKKRAKDKNLQFDIEIADIIIPDVCPILGMPLNIGNSIKERENSPSLDRIIPELGYVKGNIKVISFKANSLKRDGHIEDFEKIIEYIKRNTHE